MKTSRGFSFVELMVALVLTGILMGGMAQIYKSSLSSFYTTGELVGAHRRNRWILNQLGDDLRMAGHTDGFDVTKVPTVLPEMPFSITPGGTAASPSDQIDFFLNEPIQELTITSNVAQAATSMPLTAAGGASLGIQAGDFLTIKDGIQAEYGYARANVSSGSVALMDETTQQATSAITTYMKYGATAFQRSHPAGGRVTVLRPCQLVHYGIENLALDPSNPAATIPCLTRKQAVFGTGAQANWGAITGEVVAENVSALRFDLSVDGGINWERGGTWAATVALANGRLNAANQISTNAFWFKQVPAFIKVEIRSRTPLPRTEYSNTAGTAVFRERTQVLVIAPRNFASPL